MMQQRLTARTVAMRKALTSMVPGYNGALRWIDLLLALLMMGVGAFVRLVLRSDWALLALPLCFVIGIASRRYIWAEEVADDGR